ncbi:hypothetical protein KC19_8G029800 [Ceratodon purpureus]|uniref:Uncharacterized protein n=1 Tax=Ceratodon purpureus TaxID=3225 RepID=A0A8T0GWL4_CERPU|nr:hypothetical protein KC19_8G029800 [Ceratodon purpureus]
MDVSHENVEAISSRIDQLNMRSYPLTRRVHHSNHPNSGCYHYALNICPIIPSLSSKSGRS